MSVKVSRYRTLIFYSDADSNECKDHILKMQEEGWERINERSLVNNGYEVEFEKWVEVDLTTSYPIKPITKKGSSNEDRSLAGWSEIILNSKK